MNVINWQAIQCTTCFSPCHQVDEWIFKIVYAIDRRFTSKLIDAKLMYLVAFTYIWFRCMGFGSVKEFRFDAHDVIKSTWRSTVKRSRWAKGIKSKRIKPLHSFQMADAVHCNRRIHKISYKFFVSFVVAELQVM